MLGRPKPLSSNLDRYCCRHSCLCHRKQVGRLLPVGWPVHVGYFRRPPLVSAITAAVAVSYGLVAGTKPSFRLSARDNRHRLLVTDDGERLGKKKSAAQYQLVDGHGQLRTTKPRDASEAATAAAAAAAVVAANQLASVLLSSTAFWKPMRYIYSWQGQQRIINGTILSNYWERRDWQSSGENYENFEAFREWSNYRTKNIIVAQRSRAFNTE